MKRVFIIGQLFLCTEAVNQLFILLARYLPIGGHNRTLII